MNTDADLQQAVAHHPATQFPEATVAPAPAESEGQSGSEPIDALAGEFVATLETLAEKGLDDSVEEIARQMVQLLPEHGFGWKTLAYAYLRRGDLAGALSPLTRAAALLPHDDQLTRHLRAAAAMQEGLQLDAKLEFVDAGRRYQEVLAIHPAHPDANHKLGVVAIRLGQAAAAVPYLEQAIGADPNKMQYWANYVDALVQSEVAGPGGNVAKTLSLLELRKVGDRWIPKDVDVRNEVTRDKTRLSMTAVAVGIPVDPAAFDPSQLGAPLAKPPADRVRSVAP